jgi:hypothetical protein
MTQTIQPASYSGRLLEAYLKQPGTAVSTRQSAIAASLALAETVFYSAVVLASYPFSTQSWNDRNLAVLRSSTFAFIWAFLAHSALKQEIDCEPMARSKLSRLFPRLFGWCYQEIDAGHIRTQANWTRQALERSDREAVNARREADLLRDVLSAVRGGNEARQARRAAARDARDALATLQQLDGLLRLSSRHRVDVKLPLRSQ